MDDRRVASARPHVHRGASDGTGRRHAPEQRGDEVGEPLTEQLPIGIVRFGVAHAVGDLGREQALETSEERHRERGRRQLTELQSAEVRQCGRRKTPREIADARCAHAADAGEHRGDNHCQQRARQRAVEADGADHDRGDQQHEQQRRPVAFTPQRLADGTHGDGGGVLTIRFRYTEGSRHLLQEDDEGDADGEAFDHRPGDVGEEAADAGERRHHDHHAGHDPDHDHGTGTEARNHGDEHHRHCASGS